MSIKQNGGVFGRNPTFNDVTIEGQLTFDGDIDINSDLKIDGDLDVTGTATVDELIVDGAVQVTSNTAFSGALTGRMFKMGTNGLTLQGVTGSQNDFIVTTPAGQILIANPAGTNDLALLPTTSGNVSIGTGNLVIGTSGKGIDFSATAGTGTSELLDDYEEGTWTPSVGNYSGTITIDGASYTKTGDIVTAFCMITFDGTVDGSQVFMVGFPFAISSDNSFSAQITFASPTGAGNKPVRAERFGVSGIVIMNEAEASVTYTAMGTGKLGVMLTYKA